MSTARAAQMWGLTERSVVRACKDQRLRCSTDVDGFYLIPDDEVRPLPQRVVQSFLWVVLRQKNDPNTKPDLSLIPEIYDDILGSVFKQLEHRGYLDGIDGLEDPEECFIKCRITQKGFILVGRERLPGSWIAKKVTNVSFDIVISIIVNKLKEFIDFG